MNSYNFIAVIATVHWLKTAHLVVFHLFSISFSMLFQLMLVPWTIFAQNTSG